MTEGWTSDQLKSYIDQRLADRELLVQTLLTTVQQRFDSQDRAVTVATAAMEKRLDGMNEFRAQLGEQVNTFMPRREYQAQHDSLNVKLEDLGAQLSGRMDRQFGELANLIAVNTKAIDQRAGSESTSGKYTATILGLVGSLAGVGAVIAVIAYHGH